MSTLTKAERQEIRSWANAKIIDGAHIDDRWARDTMIALLDDLEQLKEDVADVSMRYLNKSISDMAAKVQLELRVKVLEDEIVRLKKELNNLARCSDYDNPLYPDVEGD